MDNVNVKKPQKPVFRGSQIGEQKFYNPRTGQQYDPMSSQERALLYQKILESRLDPKARDKANKRRERRDVTAGVGSGIERILKGIFAGGVGADDTDHWYKSRQVFMDRQKEREAQRDKRLSNIEKLRASEKQREDEDPTAPASRRLQEILKRRYPSIGKDLDEMSPEQIKEYGKYIFGSSGSRGATETDAERALKEAKSRWYDRRGVPGKGGSKASKGKTPSISQSKKKGLAVIGELATDQYNKAVRAGEESGEYSPRSYWDWIDNNEYAPNFLKNKSAIEAQAARDSWGDSYLRDESGAAIPIDERAKYYEIYFPQMGDTKEAMRNKAILRRQKELNARMASGDEDQNQRAVDDFGEPNTDNNRALEPNLRGKPLRREDETKKYIWEE